MMRQDPLAYLEYDHRAQRGLADLLEAVADSLPDHVNQAAAALAAGLLRDSVLRRSMLEDSALYPLAEARAIAGTPMHSAIMLARRESRDCGGRAIELAEELDALVSQGRATNAEALGFMLRAFFEGLRRHLDWVDIAILEPLRDALSSEDVDALGLRFETLRHSAHLADWAGLTVVRGVPA